MESNDMLSTERLIIRLFDKCDAESIFKLSQEKSLARWLPDQVYKNIEEAESAVNFLTSKYENKELPFVLALEGKESGAVIGHVGLSRIEQGVELGYAIGTQYQGNGYAKEAVAAFINWSREQLGLNKIYGVVDRENLASKRVLEALGFTESMQKNNKIYYII